MKNLKMSITLKQVRWAQLLGKTTYSYTETAPLGKTYNEGGCIDSYGYIISTILLLSFFFKTNTIFVLTSVLDVSYHRAPYFIHTLFCTSPAGPHVVLAEQKEEFSQDIYL